MKEIILIMQKKVFSILFIFSFLLLLPSCTKQTRIDFSELLIRTEKQLDEVSLELEDAFFSDGQWFLFVSVSGEDDILLTATQDENSYITSVGISTVRIPDSPSQKSAFTGFCNAAAAAFMSSTPAEPLLDELGLYDESLIFSEEVRFSQYERFSASFFNADMGSTVRISIE